MKPSVLVLLVAYLSIWIWAYQRPSPEAVREVSLDSKDRLEAAYLQGRDPATDPIPNWQLSDISKAIGLALQKNHSLQKETEKPINYWNELIKGLLAGIPTGLILHFISSISGKHSSTQRQNFQIGKVISFESSYGGSGIKSRKIKFGSFTFEAVYAGKNDENIKYPPSGHDLRAVSPKDSRKKSGRS